MPSNHLILCHPLLLLPSIFTSIKVFSNESALLIRCPKDWSFSFISPSNEGLISSRMDWFHLLAGQGTESLLQHHSSKASILRHSALIVQLSHPYMTTGKTTALTRQTFVGINVVQAKGLSSKCGVGSSDGKASAYNAGDLGLIPGSGRSPGEGNGNPLQHSCLENPAEEPSRLQSTGSHESDTTEGLRLPSSQFYHLLIFLPK